MTKKEDQEITDLLEEIEALRVNIEEVIERRQREKESL